MLAHHNYANTTVRTIADYQAGTAAIMDASAALIGDGILTWADVKDRICVALGGRSPQVLIKWLGQLEKFGLVARQTSPLLDEPFVHATVSGEEIATAPNPATARVLLAVQLLRIQRDADGTQIRPGVAALRCVAELDGSAHVAEYSLCAAEATEEKFGAVAAICAARASGTRPEELLADAVAATVDRNAVEAAASDICRRAADGPAGVDAAVARHAPTLFHRAKGPRRAALVTDVVRLGNERRGTDIVELIVADRVAAEMRTALDMNAAMLRYLADVGLLERDGDQYTLTPTGALALERVPSRPLEEAVAARELRGGFDFEGDLVRVLTEEVTGDAAAAYANLFDRVNAAPAEFAATICASACPAEGRPFHYEHRISVGVGARVERDPQWVARAGIRTKVRADATPFHHADGGAADAVIDCADGVRFVVEATLLDRDEDQLGKEAGPVARHLRLAARGCRRPTIGVFVAPVIRPAVVGYWLRASVDDGRVLPVVALDDATFARLVAGRDGAMAVALRRCADAFVAAALAPVNALGAATQVSDLLASFARIVDEVAGPAVA